MATRPDHDEAIGILDANRVMTIATVRPDGWPQATIVGFANDGLLLYFLVARSSQKFANIQQDNRVAIAVGQEPKSLQELEAVYANGHAVEVSGAEERRSAWRLLAQRHTNLEAFELPGKAEAALMVARCEHLSVLAKQTAAKADLATPA